MRPKDHIEWLYRKFLNKTANREEVHKLLDGLLRSKNAEELLSEMKQKWDANATDREYSGTWDEIKGRWERVTKEESERQRFRIGRITKYAAAVLVIVAVSLILWKNASPAHDALYTTDYGETRTIALPDGSRVILNAHSELTWSGDWKQDAKRVLTLKGEAFFEVVQVSGETNTKIPFEVVTDDFTVKVLGTSFNVNNRDEETRVYLESGKVELEFEDPNRETEQMSPGESINYSKVNKQISRQKSSLAESASWKEESFIYYKEELEHVIDYIRDIYGKEIVVRDTSLLKRKVNVGLPYSDWDMVVESLELMLDLKITKQEDGITIEK